jgi:hypothetical protein
VRLGIDDNPHTPIVLCHPQCQPEHEAQKVKAEPLSLRRPIDGQADESEHPQRVTREFSARGGRQGVDLDVAAATVANARMTRSSTAT